jgi:hypothetical protein
VIRAPGWFRSELEVLGKQHLNGDIEKEEAATVLHDAIFERDEPLSHGIVRDWSFKQINKWLKVQVDAMYQQSVREDETGEYQMELFSYLPRLLELSPGRFAEVSSMTRGDWDAAKRQAEVKESNASKFAEAIRRAYNHVVPLLTDEWMTTSDIAEQTE